MFFLDSALCRFESVHCAQKAKAALNGADIYAGCCTLKIEYARVSGDASPHAHTHVRALPQAVGSQSPPGSLLQARSLEGQCRLVCSLTV